MSASRPQPSRKKSAHTARNFAKYKYQEKGVRLLARLLRSKADATAVASSLAVLQLGPLDRLLNLSTQLDLTCGDQASKPDSQGKEKVRQLRLTLRLEKERVHLLRQISGGILACLGGTQRLILEAINKTNAIPCEAEPAALRIANVSMANIMMERCRAYKMQLPGFAQEIVRGMDAETVAKAERDGLLGPKPDKDKEGGPK